jgi:hypothetical protein
MGALELAHRIPRIVHDLKRKSLPALFLRESGFVKQGLRILARRDEWSMAMCRMEHPHPFGPAGAPTDKWYPLARSPFRSTESIPWCCFF